MTIRNVTFAKRQREQDQKERAREREQRKAQRRHEKSLAGPNNDQVDPDIAGIVPGPQPKPEED